MVKGVVGVVKGVLGCGEGSGGQDSVCCQSRRIDMLQTC